jgi:hypothetical protein
MPEKARPVCDLRLVLANARLTTGLAPIAIHLKYNDYLRI